MINHRQHATIRALVTGTTQRHAAELVGVCPQTVSEWMGDADFRRALADAQRDALVDAGGALLALAHEAVGTLREVMTDPDAPPAVRVRAATEVLSRVGMPATTRTIPGPMDTIDADTDERPIVHVTITPELADQIMREQDPD